MKIPTAATAPKKSATGAKFVKSAGSSGVKPARDRGETRVGPSGCTSKRSASNLRHTY